MAVVPHTVWRCAVWQDATHWIALSSVPIARCLHHVSGPYPERGGFQRTPLVRVSCSRLCETMRARDLDTPVGETVRLSPHSTRHFPCGSIDLQSSYTRVVNTTCTAIESTRKAHVTSPMHVWAWLLAMSIATVSDPGHEPVTAKTGSTQLCTDIVQSNPVQVTRRPDPGYRPGW